MIEIRGESFFLGLSGLTGAWIGWEFPEGGGVPWFLGGGENAVVVVVAVLVHIEGMGVPKVLYVGMVWGCRVRW